MKPNLEKFSYLPSKLFPMQALKSENRCSHIFNILDEPIHTLLTQTKSTLTKSRVDCMIFIVSFRI